MDGRVGKFENSDTKAIQSEGWMQNRPTQIQTYIDDVQQNGLLVNMMSKNVYIIVKDSFAYQMQTLLYDTNFNWEDMAWIFFSNFLTTFYVKESLFSLATVVRKTIHL